MLGLDQLELVATEWKVETFALDVLARGLDADGEVTVVIENQYGFTDHRHLGQLLTYAAHAAAGGHRVLAVWLTEEVRPAHLAAVEFLNRVAAEGSTFGTLLLRVRFAPAPTGWHVYFEVDSEPNAFLSVPTPTPGPGPSTEPRADFVTAVAADLDPALESLGLRRRGNVNTKNGAVVYRFPFNLDVARVATARVVCTADTVNVGLYLQKYRDARQNWAAAEVLRRTYEARTADYGLRVDTWHGSGPNIKGDRVLTHLYTGYATGDPHAVAHEAATVLGAWTRMLTEHPRSGLEDLIADLAESGEETTWDDTAPDSD